MIEYARDAAVVLCQRDNGRVSIMIAEFMNIVDIGALETINRLVVVAHCHHVWLFTAGDIEQQAELRQVGILEFIDQHIMVLFLQVRPEIGARFDGVDDV